MLINIMIAAFGAPLAFAINFCFLNGDLGCLIPMLVLVGPISYSVALLHGLLFIYALHYLGLNKPIYLPLLSVSYIILFFLFFKPSMLTPGGDYKVALQYIFCGLCCCAIYHRRFEKSKNKIIKTPRRRQ